LFFALFASGGAFFFGASFYLVSSGGAFLDLGSVVFFLG
jgi:hypothetical protein